MVQEIQKGETLIQKGETLVFHGWADVSRDGPLAPHAGRCNLYALANLGIDCG